VAESTDSKVVVELKGVSKLFDNVQAVAETDLQIERGNLVTLLGPSGCGKTTILRMIAGLEDPSSGDIYIKGRRVNDVPVHKRNLGMIFQNYALFPHKTIFENVAFGLKYRSVPKDEVKKRVTRALDIVRLPGVEKRKPAQLSGGQQQRIALARAIVIEPDVLLMDEPLSALDENLREEMRREVDNIQAELGITTIFVTHDQREALSMSDRIVVMKDGFKIQEGHPEHVYNYPVNHFVADFLGHSNFLEGVVESTEGEHVRVKAAGGHIFSVDHPGHWNEGQKVRLVIRAQKFHVYADDEETPQADVEENIFEGKVKDRSYMGGEVSYFIELSDGIEVHAISMIRHRPIRSGEHVTLRIAPRHCGLLERGES
jgi:putative spermidine/putrescine transport system ATP-binding protein/spermidine/putrescine transport system ATP-binding protein